MNFYPFHIGDYLCHTRHLSIIEDIAYRRMLDVYYTHERPLRGPAAAIARAIGMGEYVAAVELILREFFVESESGFRNLRADSELAAYHEKITKRVKAGRASGRARRRIGTHDEHMSNTCSTHVEHTGTGTGSLSDAAQGEVQERVEKAPRRVRASMRRGEFDFEKFWDYYGHRVGKKKAAEAWDRIDPDPELAERICWQASRYHKACLDADHPRKHPTTWLNGEHWNDEDLPKPKVQPLFRRS